MTNNMALLFIASSHPHSSPPPRTAREELERGEGGGMRMQWSGGFSVLCTRGSPAPTVSSSGSTSQGSCSRSPSCSTALPGHEVTQVRSRWSSLIASRSICKEENFKCLERVFGGNIPWHRYLQQPLLESIAWYVLTEWNLDFPLDLVALWPSLQKDIVVWQVLGELTKLECFAYDGEAGMFAKVAMASMVINDPHINACQW